MKSCLLRVRPGDIVHYEYIDSGKHETIEIFSEANQLTSTIAEVTARNVSSSWEGPEARAYRITFIIDPYDNVRCTVRRGRR